MSDYRPVFLDCLQECAQFARDLSGLRLRRYQFAVARAIVESVVHGYGDTIVVMFPRQSGKNELQAQVECYLLTLYAQLNADMVKVSPTWKPQTENAMRRLERVLRNNIVTMSRWKKESGYIYRLDSARVTFLSGSPAASVVGATASHLLECDEAQDVGIAKWDKEFAPMVASRNATRVFWGTAWTSKTLLARELRLARLREQELAAQGTPRRLAFVLTANDVRKEVHAYGRFVDGQIARLGRNHPLVRTQFFSEEIDSEGGMFPASRIALMKGTHSPKDSPPPLGGGQGGGIYCLLLDVAGTDESLPPDGGETEGGKRDSTALTIVEVDLASLEDELIQAPTYRVVSRKEWVGVKHTTLYGQIKALAEHWQARYLVVDATGIGAGLASFLEKALPGRVIPFIFTQKSKSDLGWAFLAAIETGRYKEYLPDGQHRPEVAGPQDRTLESLQRTFWRQVGNCQSQILEGPGKIIRWGVPDGYRDEASGELVHDDLLVSAALVGLLDGQVWGLARSSVKYTDPLEEFDDVY
jgi:hypothetical protein